MNTSETSPTPDQTTPAAPKPPRFMERLRHFRRQRQWRLDQSDAMGRWVVVFIQYHGLRHPRELGADHVAALLAQLRRDPETTPSREAAARTALKFLYEEFLVADIDPPTADQARASTNPSSGRPATASPLLNRCHAILRVRHYSLRTVEENELRPLFFSEGEWAISPLNLVIIPARKVDQGLAPAIAAASGWKEGVSLSAAGAQPGRDRFETGPPTCKAKKRILRSVLLLL